MDNMAGIQNDVFAWMGAFGLETNNIAFRPSTQQRDLWVSLIKEEVKELLDAAGSDDLVGIADGAADAIWVILGLTNAFGIDMVPVWEEVLCSNMAKQGGGRREDGKILKPDGWQPPQIREILRKQGANV